MASVTPLTAEETQSLATPVEQIHTPEGFEVELLYTVPKDRQGSWVALTATDKNEFYVSDQYGPLYRLPVPAPGQKIQESDVKPVGLDIGEAQGLLWAHDSLYVVLNTGNHGGRGLYRLRDTNNDGELDEKTLLKKFQEDGGEHGPHAVIAGPDGKSIYVICGNQTALPEYNRSRTPALWQEDNLLPRIYGRGFMKGVLAPRGWIAKTDPDGKDWEIVSIGFRNPYDAAFNTQGELFTYDADMEWDINMPWYRPTRVNHVISGADFGWRNGSAKWPAWYPDSFGASVDIGPGSPTGVTFGTGAKFPAKYQQAVYLCDWSYGKLFAAHLTPDGASYTGEFEEFIAGQPLPLTDILVRPEDGAMYFTTGGRKVQSALYRVTYKGAQSTAPAPVPAVTPELEQLRTLSELHHAGAPNAVQTAWPFLGNKDRALRHAARVALEHQPVESWKDLALAEKDPQAAATALVALCRAGKDKVSLEEMIRRLGEFDFASLEKQIRLDLLRAYTLAFTRLGNHPQAGADTPGMIAGKEPEKAEELVRGFREFLKTVPEGPRSAAAARLEALFPAPSTEENLELAHLLVYTRSPNAAAKLTAQLQAAPTQEEQINYAFSLRLLEDGWNEEARKAYFEWFVRAANYKGGANFSMFMDEIKRDAVDALPEEQKTLLAEVINAKPDPAQPQFSFTVKPFVQAWKTSDFNDVIHVGLEGGRNFENGRNMFGVASCYACHRFQQEGGALGPDLTSAAGKYSPTDLLEHIIEPSKEISDQYGAMVFVKKDGSQVVGRVMNLNGDHLMITTDMMNPDGSIISLNTAEIAETKASPVSMMPPGLLNNLTKDDVLDLLAFLLSKGNAEDPLFR